MIKKYTPKGSNTDFPMLKKTIQESVKLKFLLDLKPGQFSEVKMERETPFIYTVMLPVTGIVGSGYGGLLGLFSYAVFRANRRETVSGSQDSAVET